MGYGNDCNINLLSSDALPNVLILFQEGCTYQIFGSKLLQSMVFALWLKWLFTIKELIAITEHQYFVINFSKTSNSRSYIATWLYYTYKCGHNCEHYRLKWRHCDHSVKKWNICPHICAWGQFRKHATIWSAHNGEPSHISGTERDRA